MDDTKPGQQEIICYQTNLTKHGFEVKKIKNGFLGIL
jgi:hypothetical protein